MARFRYTSSFVTIAVLRLLANQRIVLVMRTNSLPIIGHQPFRKILLSRWPELLQRFENNIRDEEGNNVMV